MKDRIFPQSDAGLPWTESFPVHLVHFYDDGAFPDRSIADFLWTGLQADESAVIIATSEHMGALRECLTTRGAALHALERSGRLTALDAHATLEQLRGEGLPDRARLLSILSPTLDQAAAAAPNGRWRMFGEMTALLAEEGNIKGSIELERLWNELFSTRSFRLYCAYPIRQFAHESLAEPFSQMCGEHDEVVPVLTWLDKPERHGRWLVVLQQRARALQVEINERQQAEEALRQAEAKYRGIFENAVEGIFQSTPSGTFITANPALARMLGYDSPAELMATITDIQAQLYVEPERRSEFTRLLGENDSQPYKVELYRKDGSTVWVSGNVRAVRDTSRQVLYYEGMAEDITERMRAEEELQRRADEFAALYDTARDLATQQDFSTLVQAIVERALSLLNLSAGGISLYDPTRGDLEVVFAKEGVVPLGTRVPFGEGITGRVAQNRQPLIINDFPTWKPGSPWLAGKGIKSLMSVPMLSGGELIGVLSVGEHKTERKFTDADARLLSLFAAQAASAIRNAHLLEETRTRAEQLAISEERFSKAFHASPTPMVIARQRDGVIMAINDKLLKILGYTREEVMGRTVVQIGALDKEQRQMVRSTLQGDSVRDMEITLRTKSGDNRTFLASVEITEMEGEKCALGSCIDITERKRAEESLRKSEARYRLLAENATDVIWTADLNFRLTYISPSIKYILGYSVEEAMAQTMAAFLTPPSVEVAQQALQEELALEKMDQEDSPRTRTLELESIRKNGSRVWTEVKMTSIHSPDGQPIGVLGVTRDISERKRLEEQLRQSQKMEAIGLLAGGIAHDFNNLLTAILGYSSLLLANLDEDSPLRPDIVGIKKAGERAASLTRQLLAFSRQQVLQLELLNLNTVVANMGQMLYRLIGEDIDLVTILETGLKWVKADLGQIEQVIINLVVNARDAMPEGGKLTLETTDIVLDKTYARYHVGVKPGPYVLLTISDTGQGMDAETQTRIFDPFFTTKEQGKGTGLGLAMVHGIVNQIGGHIWVYSELGQGTTFKIYLPQVEVAGELATPSQASAKPRPGWETILLVEDGDLVREMVHQVLQRDGYTVMAADNGTQAYQIATAHQGPIHLLLTDVVMPGGTSGPQLATNLRASRPEMKVLYMSGYTDNAIVHHGVLEPGITFLEKPFSSDALIRKIRAVLDTECE